MKEIVIDAAQKGQRLDKFVLKYLNKAPASFVYKMLRKKNIKLNDKRASGNELLNEGDSIKLFFSDETVSLFRQEKGEIKKTSSLPEIIYEDENIIALNKPAGLIVHPDVNHKTDTLNDRIIYYLYSKGEYLPGDVFKPSVCNRLDINTSGVVVAGKNYAALRELSRAFKEHSLKKEYLTVVKGEIKTPGQIEGYLAKTEGNFVTISPQKEKNTKYVKTLYSPIKVRDGFTLLNVELLTGKSHQIRACLSYIGHPIVGDGKYGDMNTNRYFYGFGLKNQLLHAKRLTLFTENELKYLWGKELVAPENHVFKRVLKGLNLNV